MSIMVLFCAIVILSCIVTNKFSNKLGMPTGDTILKEGDEVLVGATYSKSTDEVNLHETFIDKNHEWLNLAISELDLPKTHLIALIKRAGEYFVPNGKTKIELNDIIIFYNI